MRGGGGEGTNVRRGSQFEIYGKCKCITNVGTGGGEGTNVREGSQIGVSGKCKYNKCWDSGRGRHQGKGRIPA